MSLGWHKQRALYARAFAKPKRTPPPERSLEEEITHLRAELAKLREGGPARSQVRRQLEQALHRQRVREVLDSEP